MGTLFSMYAKYEGKIYKLEAAGDKEVVTRLHSSDDEYWTAIEWLTERGWL